MNWITWNHIACFGGTIIKLETTDFPSKCKFGSARSIGVDRDIPPFLGNDVMCTQVNQMRDHKNGQDTVGYMIGLLFRMVPRTTLSAKRARNIVGICKRRW
jgi:hypothetical protein